MHKEIVPVKFTTDKPSLSHARRPGERFSICGQYVRISYRFPESPVPDRPLCRKCSEGLMAEPKVS
jgi:hypothetical protein